MNVKLNLNWKKLLNNEFNKLYFQLLANFIRNEYQKYTCYPPANKIFAAFDYCPFNELKVVIVGQDPYYNINQANGLCFGVDQKSAFPPSLQNIFKELYRSLSKPFPKNGDLINWAKQGVLLLNTVLTVRAGKANSHQGKGWEIFTDAVIQEISNEKKNIVFLLWGSYAKRKKEIINKNYHYILESTHPSPFSAYYGFLGCNHFFKTNQFLKKKGITPINW